MKFSKQVLSLLVLAVVLAGCNKPVVAPNAPIKDSANKNVSGSISIDDKGKSQSVNGSITIEPANEKKEETKVVETALKPYREASEGCKWGELADAQKIGLRMLVETCKGDEGKFTVVNNTVVYKVGVSSGDDVRVEAFEKKDGETMEQSIKRQFIDTLKDANEKKNCVVEKNKEDYENGRVTYSIVPNATYDAELQTHNEDGVEACGDYGRTNGLQYFIELEPASKKFVFERIGQDFSNISDIRAVLK